MFAIPWRTKTKFAAYVVAENQLNKASYWASHAKIMIVSTLWVHVIEYQSYLSSNPILVNAQAAQNQTQTKQKSNTMQTVT